MAFHDRSRAIGLMLLCLAALGYPRAAGAELEGFSPFGLASEPPVEARAVEPSQGEPILPLSQDPSEQGPGADLETSDGAETQSFSPPPPPVPPPHNPEGRRILYLLPTPH